MPTKMMKINESFRLKVTFFTWLLFSKITQLPLVMRPARPVWLQRDMPSTQIRLRDKGL